MEIVTLSKERLHQNREQQLFLENIQEFFSRNIMLAGGSIRDMILGETVSDFDFFANDKNPLDEFKKHLEAVGFKILSDTEKLVSLKREGLKVQLVHRYSNGFKELFERFDFTMCCFGFDGLTVFATPEALCDAHSKKLIVNSISNAHAIDSLKRILKYQVKGYRICDKELGLIAQKLRDIPQSDFENQLQFYSNGTLRANARFD